MSISSLLHQRIDYPIMNQSIIVDVHHQYIVALNECRSCGFLFLLLRRNILLIQFIKTLRNVSFLHGKRIPPRIFFSPQAEVFPRASLPPRGSSLRTSEARAVIETQGVFDKVDFAKLFFLFCGANFERSLK